MFLKVNPCFQKAHIFCMDLQPAADPHNVVCRSLGAPLNALNLKKKTSFLSEKCALIVVKLCVPKMGTEKNNGLKPGRHIYVQFPGVRM